MEIWIDRPVTYMSNILRMKIRNIKYHNNLSYYHLDSLSSYFIPSQHTNIKNIPDCSRIFDPAIPDCTEEPASDDAEWKDPDISGDQTGVWGGL